MFTAPQVQFASYAVSVDATLTDRLGASVLPSDDTAPFYGYGPVAVVRINEVNAIIASECDLVELRVTASGSMDALELWTRDGAVATFPGMFVERNDLIVVHFGTFNACITGVLEETVSPIQHPVTINSGNFDGAYDRVTSETLSQATNVLSIRHRDGDVLEAMTYADAPTGTVADFTEQQTIPIAEAGAWTAPNGTVPEGGFVDEAFRSSAVLDANSTGTTRAGSSMQRLDNLDRNTRDDWDNTSMTASTWAALNPGQTEL